MFSRRLCVVSVSVLWDLRVEPERRRGQQQQQQQSWSLEAWIPRLAPSLTCSVSLGKQLTLSELSFHLSHGSICTCLTEVS